MQGDSGDTPADSSNGRWTAEGTNSGDHHPVRWRDTKSEGQRQEDCGETQEKACMVQLLMLQCC